jgi:hypothetical protein
MGRVRHAEFGAKGEELFEERGIVDRGGKLMELMEIMIMGE